MKIVHVCPRYYPFSGGVEVVVKNISECFYRLGHKVKVFTTDPSIFAVQRYSLNGVELQIYPCLAPKQAYYLPSPKMFLDILKEEVDIIHAHNIHSLTTLTACSVNTLFKKQNIHFVVSPYYHGKGHTPFADILQIPYKPLIRKILESVDCVIVNSKSQREIIKQYKQAVSYTIYDGINLSRLSSSVPFNKYQNIKIILYVGRLERYKNVHVTIQALKYLPLNYHFFIIGSGPFKSQLINYVKSIGLENRVHFLGFQSDLNVYRWFKTADVFVHLSSVESFGMTCIESLAAGTPVIANNDGLGLSETIQLFPKSIQSYIVDEEPISRLSSLIMNFSNSKPLNEDLSLFSWEKIALNLLSIYKKIIKTTKF